MRTTGWGVLLIVCIVVYGWRRLEARPAREESSQGFTQALSARNATPAQPLDADTARFARVLREAQRDHAEPYAPTRNRRPLAEASEPITLRIYLPSWIKRELTQQHPKPRAPATVACRDAKPVGPIEALAAPDRTIVACCRPAKAPPGRYTELVVRATLNKPEQCTYAMSTKAGWVRATTRKQLAAVLGPAHNAAEAFGRVALVQGALILPIAGYGPGELPHLRPGAHEEAPYLFDVSLKEVGAVFEIAVVALFQLGNTRDLVEFVYVVDADGLVSKTADRLIVGDGLVTHE